MDEPSQEIRRQIYLPLQNYLTSKNYKNIKYIIFENMLSDSGMAETIATCRKDFDITDLYVLDGSWEDYGVKRYNDIATRFSEEGIKNFIVLSGNGYHYHRKINQIVYYPFFWKLTKCHGQFLTHDSQQPKKYIFSSLNGRARWHRVLLAKCMLDKPYIDQCAVTFNASGLPDHRLSIWEQPTNWWVDLEFAGAQRQPLLSFVKERLPYKNCQTDDYPLNFNNIANDVYQNAYVNVITETNVHQPFFTEKTFKAVISGQLFVSINASGSLDFLRSVGFDTFDDIIDPSYDKILDPYKKILAVSDLLDELIKLDWPAIWKSTQERRRKNVEHFFSDACEQLIDYHLKQENL